MGFAFRVGPTDYGMVAIEVAWQEDNGRDLTFMVDVTAEEARVIAERFHTALATLDAAPPSSEPTKPPSDSGLMGDNAHCQWRDPVTGRQCAKPWAHQDAHSFCHAAPGAECRKGTCPKAIANPEPDSGAARPEPADSPAPGTWVPGSKCVYVGSYEEIYGHEAVVVAVRAPGAVPGKDIAICFKQPYPGGHGCDGLVPNGHGRWTTADQIVSPAPTAAAGTGEYKEFRADGWPLCPRCGEDELYCLTMPPSIDNIPKMPWWIERIDGCYRCNWKPPAAPAAPPSPSTAEGRDGDSDPHVVNRATMEWLTRERDTLKAKRDAAVEIREHYRLERNKVLALAERLSGEVAVLKDECEYAKADLAAERSEVAALKAERQREIDRFQAVLVNLHGIATGDPPCDPRTSIGMATSAVQHLKAERDLFKQRALELDADLAAERENVEWMKGALEAARDLLRQARDTITASLMQVTVESGAHRVAYRRDLLDRIDAALAGTAGEPGKGTL